jgi:hypothetical protein
VCKNCSIPHEARPNYGFCCNCMCYSSCAKYLISHAKFDASFMFFQWNILNGLTRHMPTLSKLDLSSILFAGNTLVDMYSKCGSIELENVIKKIAKPNNHMCINNAIDLFQYAANLF